MGDLRNLSGNGRGTPSAWGQAEAEMLNAQAFLITLALDMDSRAQAWVNLERDPILARNGDARKILRRGISAMRADQARVEKARHAIGAACRDLYQGVRGAPERQEARL